MLAFIPENAHRVEVDGRAMLMHVPSTGLYEMDAVARDVFDLFARAGVADAEARVAELGKTVDFSLTTNGTLLSGALVDWPDAHRFGLTESMDGPKALHDVNRRNVGGRGT